MSNRILAIGINIPGNGIDSTSINSRVSLLDYDISVFNPELDSFYSYPKDHYMGKPLLEDTNSFNLKETITHWRREITEAVKFNKTVFVFFSLNSACSFVSIILYRSSIVKYFRG